MTTQREATRNVSYAPLFEANACEFASSQQHLLVRNHASPPEARRLKASDFLARALSRVPIWGRPRRRNRPRRVASLHRTTNERRGGATWGQPSIYGEGRRRRSGTSVLWEEVFVAVSWAVGERGSVGGAQSWQSGSRSILLNPRCQHPLRRLRWPHLAKARLLLRRQQALQLRPPTIRTRHLRRIAIG